MKASVFVGTSVEVCFRLPSDSRSPEKPLPPLTLADVGCVGDFHPPVSAPCRAHQKKPRARRGFQIYLPERV
jgi:hypothetical protein